MKTLLCEQAGRGSLRYLLFEDAEGGTCRYSVLDRKMRSFWMRLPG